MFKAAPVDLIVDFLSQWTVADNGDENIPPSPLEKLDRLDEVEVVLIFNQSSGCQRQRCSGAAQMPKELLTEHLAIVRQRLDHETIRNDGHIRQSELIAIMIGYRRAHRDMRVDAVRHRQAVENPAHPAPQTVDRIARVAEIVKSHRTAGGWEKRARGGDVHAAKKKMAMKNVIPMFFCHTQQTRNRLHEVPAMGQVEAEDVDAELFERLCHRIRRPKRSYTAAIAAGLKRRRNVDKRLLGAANAKVLNDKQN